MRVEITLVRVEIPAVSVAITFLDVKITLRVEITLFFVSLCIKVIAGGGRDKITHGRAYKFLHILTPVPSL
jgi:hypothetical protein